MPAPNSHADRLANLPTEQRNASSMDLDLLSSEQILRLMNCQDKLVPVAVEKQIPQIVRAVDMIVEALKNGGRLLYAGAGTSGRLGVVDASECPPTFGTDPEQVKGIIAGGRDAVFRSQEGAEDDAAAGRRDIDREHTGPRDVVCGIAASSVTPYVVAAVARGRELGAKTIFIATNPAGELVAWVDVAICPEVGPEVLMGSTRLKSGSAQKLVLNMLTTAAMVKLGKVYENMMVDLHLSSVKLQERGKRIVALATGANEERAVAVLKEAGGHVKTAIVMIAGNLSAAEAGKKLEAAGGFVRQALQTR